MELDAVEEDLYGDLDAASRQLPSTIELRAQLAKLGHEREALEAQLQGLQSEEQASRDALRDLTRRACVLLMTARLELKRKDEQISQYSMRG